MKLTFIRAIQMASFQLRDDIHFDANAIYAMVCQRYSKGSTVAETGSLVAIVEGDVEVDRTVFVVDLVTERQYKIPVEPYLKVLYGHERWGLNEG